MFFGTGLIFKSLYFISAMAPAYLLFSLQLFIYNGIGTLTIFNINLPWITFLIIILALVNIIIIKRVLYRATRLEENFHTIDLVRIKILQVNGDIVSFFVGVILPAVFFIEQSVVISSLVFLTIQLLIFILVSKSNTVFPNVLLVLYGLNIYTLDNGEYLVTNCSPHELKEKKLSSVRLGDNSHLLCYVNKRTSEGI